MGGRISRAAAASLAIVALAPSDAFADLGLIFDRARAAPGERVEAFSGQKGTGRPEGYPPIEDVRVYFVPVELVTRQTNLRSTGPPTDPGWFPLGPVHQDGEGVIRMLFRVPRVPAGDYTTGFWCRPCAPPEGDFFTSARPQEQWRPHPFRRVIRIGAPARTATRESPDEASATGSSDGGDGGIRVVFGISAALLLVGASLAALTFSRRRTRA